MATVKQVTVETNDNCHSWLLTRRKRMNVKTTLTFMYFVDFSHLAKCFLLSVSFAFFCWSLCLFSAFSWATCSLDRGVKSAGFSEYALRHAGHRPFSSVRILCQQNRHICTAKKTNCQTDFIKQKIKCACLVVETNKSQKVTGKNKQLLNKSVIQTVNNYCHRVICQIDLINKEIFKKLNWDI